MALFAVTTALRADQWSNSVDQGQYEVTHHPLSARANYEMGRIYNQSFALDPKHDEQLRTLARQYFIRSSELDKNGTQGLFALIFSGGTDKTTLTDQWLKEATKRLATRPISAMSAVSLASYIKCQYEKHCPVNPTATRDLLNAALSNHTISFNGLSKALIESRASEFYLAGILDPEQAVHYARLAAHTLPNELQYKINLANILIAVGRYDEADTILRTARQMDHTGAYALRIAAQEKFLDESKHGIDNIPEQSQP